MVLFISNQSVMHFKDPLDERRGRRLQQKLQMSQLQRRLERFALEGGRGEMGIEFRIKDRPNSIQVCVL